MVLTAIVDPRVRGEEIILPVDVRGVADLSACADEAIDLFVVATPSDTHARVAIDVLQTSSSAMILMGKPLVTDWRADGSSKRTELRRPRWCDRPARPHRDACTVVKGGRVLDISRVSSATPRSTVHHRAMYEVLVRDPDNPDLSLATAERIWIGLNAEHEVVDTILGSIGPQRLRTLADRARTRTEPDPHVTVAATPQPSPEEWTGPPPIVVVPQPLPAPSMDPGCTASDRTYVVQEGDTLSIIAEAVYGDPLLFGPIAEANALGGSNVMQVGQVLQIPDCETPSVVETAPLAVAPAIDADVQQALQGTAPERWQPLSTDLTDGLVYGDADSGIVIRQLLLDGDSTAEAVIAEAVADGAARVDLPDGAHAAFTNPVATGQLLVPLPGGRVLQIAGEGELTGPSDYDIDIYQQWMGAVRASLS